VRRLSAPITSAASPLTMMATSHSTSIWLVPLMRIGDVISGS
jgi:hypothetical protein